MKKRLESAVKKASALLGHLECMAAQLERQDQYQRDLFDDVLYAKDKVFEALDALKVRLASTPK